LCMCIPPLFPLFFGSIGTNTGTWDCPIFWVHHPLDIYVRGHGNPWTNGYFRGHLLCLDSMPQTEGNSCIY
jgi:hypothetical protein